MNSRRLIALAASAALIAVLACDDTTQPPPPDQPPQIATYQSWTRSQGLPSNDVYDILVTTGGQLWIGTQAGIAVYPGLTSSSPTTVFNELNGLPNPKVRRMIEYNGKIYVATWGGGIGIYDIAGGTWTAKGVSNGMLAGNVSDLAASPAEDYVYCGTTNGVSIYRVALNNFTSFTSPNLLDKVVSAVELRDAGGTLERWYGPRYENVIAPGAEEGQHGITVARGASTVYAYTLANSGLADARVNDIFNDTAPIVWVATSTGGLARVDTDNSTWAYSTTEQGLPSNQVYSATRAHDTMWVGTQEGLARLKGDGVHWQSYDHGGGLQASRVRRVYSDDGENLWLCFIEGGAARVNPASAQ